MKSLVLLLTLLARDPWWGTDKAYHLTVSHLLANALAMHTELSPGQIALFTIGVGVGKEVVDLTIRGTGFSLKDLFWDGVGTFGALYLPPGRPSGTSGTTTLQMDFPPYHRPDLRGITLPSTGKGVPVRPSR